MSQGRLEFILTQRNKLRPTQRILPLLENSI